MELEKMPSKDVESKKPLTQEQAIQRLLTLESELEKVYYKNPNRSDWVATAEKNTDLGVHSEVAYQRSTEQLPLMPRPTGSPSNSALYEKQIELVKRNYRYAFPISLGAVTISTVTVALTPLSLWFTIPALVWLISGAIVGISSSLKLYDGSKKSKIRHFLASIFLTKKSKEIIEKHKEKLEKFELLKPTYEALVKLAKLEIEKDDLLEIANQSPDDKGNYLVFLEFGVFARVSKETYLKIQEANKVVPSKEEVLELAQKMLEQKCASLTMEALSK